MTITMTMTFTKIIAITKKIRASGVRKRIYIHFKNVDYQGRMKQYSSAGLANRKCMQGFELFSASGSSERHFSVILSMLVVKRVVS